jgi:hypothetical protein
LRCKVVDVGLLELAPFVLGFGGEDDLAGGEAVGEGVVGLSRRNHRFRRFHRLGLHDVPPLKEAIVGDWGVSS